MLDFLEEVYTVNKDNYLNYRILRNFSRWNWLIMKFVLIMFGSSFALVTISPLPIYLITNHLESIFPIDIPFVNTETTAGYAIHFTYLFFVMTTAYFGTAASELLTIVFTIHISPLVRIFDQAIKALNVASAGRKQEAIETSTWLRENFRNIVLMHIEIYS